jgi:hypothetical protein
VEKNGRVGRGTDESLIQRMRFTCWITKATKTRTQVRAFCFPTATMVSRNHLSVTSYVHCLSFLIYTAESHSTVNVK